MAKSSSAPVVLQNLLTQLQHYAKLMRLDKPIGIWLLLWPTLWALWLAGEGHPDPGVFVVFVAGVVVMRSAGCVLNDYADRKIDPSYEIHLSLYQALTGTCLAPFLRTSLV